MKHLIIGTAGHIDHGKTALIKALTNVDCDTHKEEKMRGITINLGFSYLNLPNGESLGIIDVPGHKDFINTMVSGASGIDMVLLVIAADSGIMPQTIEHINIITALGISKGVVALTKTDLVDDELSEIARFEIADFLDKTALKDAPIVGCSAITGQGLDDLVKTIERITSEIRETEKSSLFRMYIDRLFTVKGFGSVVTGSVLGGKIEVGNDVFLLPGSNQKFRIRSIERHGKTVEKVVAGDRAAINLIGLKSEDFERGMIISDKMLGTTELIDAYITLFVNVAAIPVWSQVTFISGTFECQAKMHVLDRDEVHPGNSTIVQIHLHKPAVLVNKDKFILRNSSADTTICGGYVVDASPLHHKRRTPKLIGYLSNLSVNPQGEQSLTESMTIELKKEFKPLVATELADRLHVKIEELVNVPTDESLHFKNYQTNEGLIFIHREHDHAFREKIIKNLKEFHAQNPMLPGGLDLNEIAGKLGFGKVKQYRNFIEVLLLEMQSNDLVDFVKNSWTLKGHKPTMDKQTTDEMKWLEDLILQFDLEKPVLSEIGEQCSQKKISAAKLKMYLNYLADQGSIRFYQSDFVHTKVLDKCRRLLLNVLSEKPGGIDVQEYKDILGGTKRFRALIGDLLEAEKSINMQHGDGIETRYFMNETGKQFLREGLN